MTTHAECSPSQLSRVIGCPGSRRLIRALQEEKDKKGTKEETNIYAKEGTMLHECTEFLIHEHLLAFLPDNYNINRLNPFDKDIIENITNLEKEQRTVVDECIEYFDKVLREAMLLGKVNIWLEADTSLAYLDLPEVAGHADVAMQISLPDGEVVVIAIDWKFGQGVPVSVVNNPQVLAYASGLPKTVGELDLVKEFHMHVFQPRLNYVGVEIVSNKKMTDWIFSKLKPAIEASREASSICIPGEAQCRWCPIGRCRVRAEMAMEACKELFGEFAVNPDLIPDEEVVHMMDKVKEVASYIKALTARALKQCLNGDGFPNYKAVEGRSSRKWKEEQKAKDFLMQLVEAEELEFEDLYITKFISVAQAEKLNKEIKKSKEFKNLWQKYPGKPTLVKDSDPRPSYSENLSDTFKEFVKE